MPSEKDLQDAHNKGEKAQRDSVEKPAGILEQVLGVGNYRPPSPPEEKKAYDEGWENAKKQGPN